MSDQPQVSIPLSMHKRRTFDTAFRWLTLMCACFLLLLVLAFLVQLTVESLPSIRRFGVGFLWERTWNPVTQEFGAAFSIFGTMATTIIAMVIAVPLSIVTALFLVELAPGWLSKIVGTAVELLAAIPSIIFGMWGFFYFAPVMSKYVQPALGDAWSSIPLLGRLELFSGPPMGIGVLTAGMILAIMILPFVCSVTRDVFLMVPNVVRESAYGMGATTWEVTRRVTLGYGIRGVIGACFLGLGRAIGETMAVTFVIGNKHHIASSVFAQGTTITSTLANEFNEAVVTPLYRSALIELGLILFVLTFVLQVIARVWLHQLSKSTGASR